MKDRIIRLLKLYIKDLKKVDSFNIIYIDGFYNSKTDKLELNFKEKIDLIK